MKNIKLISCIIAVLITMTLSAFALSGTGTEADPYLVSTTSDIALMHNDLDGYYKLTVDIDMKGVDFEPIGNESEGAFTGTVDGDGHTISNLDINLPGSKYVGFVGYLEGNVKNLNLENVDACGYMYVGGIAGFVLDVSSVNNCVVDGKVDGAFFLNNVYTGGIAGVNYGRITDCIKHGSVSSSYYYTGGVSGVNYGSIIDCTNDGSVSSKCYAGGIAGENYKIITNCTNIGSVYCTEEYAGGIVGDNGGTIENCTNSGNVSAYDYYAGGISGYNNGTITNCTNSGDISCIYMHSGTGGIVGKNEGKIEKSINYGSVSSSGSSYNTSSYYFSYAGGIASNNSNYGTIINCINNGNIKSSTSNDSYAGGIVGRNYGSITKCINSGNVSSYSSYSFMVSFAGGITGENVAGIIKDSANAGRVSSSIKDPSYNMRTGGVVGNNSGGTITKCMNVGNVINNHYSFKGIVGVNSTSGKLDCCYSLDAISPTYYGVSYSDLKDQETFVGFNFENSWFITSDTNSGFPQLRNMPRHIDLNECVLLLKVGESDKLEAFIDGVPESVTWSSENEDIAKVSADGTVTAIATGDIMITATNDEGMKMNCLVHITKDVSSVSLNKNETQITAGSSEMLAYTLNPVDANEVVMWSSSDETVATVDQSGVVTAKTKGTATISVTTVTSNKTASCEVTVVGAPITSVSIPSSATVNKGTPYKLSLTVSPTQYEGTVTWSSSDETVATVSQDGTVTGLKAGNAVITVKSDTGYTDTCTITVKIPSTAITLNKTELTLETGFTEKLIATLEPADSTDTVSWSTSSTSRISVASDGTLTAKSTGTATITATTTSGLKAYCFVTVIAAKVPVSSVTIDKTELIMTKADMAQLKASVLPTNATNQNLTWVSSDESVATVNSTGVVTAVDTGVAIIKATSNNGMYHECVVRVISASGPSIVLDGAKASPGGKAVVKANIVKNPGMSAYKFTLKYDKSKLTPVKAVGNAEFGGSFSDNIDDVLNGNVIESVYTLKVDESVTYHSSGVTVNSVNSDGFSGTTVNNNGLLHFKDSIEVDVTNVKQVVVRAQIPKGERLEIFYLKEGMTDFAQTYSARITTDSDEMKDYVFDLSADENFTGMIYGFRIDPTSNVGVDFKIESVKFMGLSSLDKSEINVLWYSTEDVDIDGELFTVEFAASGDVVYGDSTDVQILYSGTDICNTNGDFLALYTKNATVEFKEPMPGDVYEDEDVNVYDLTLEARYITALETFTARQKEAGDINNDLLVDIKDVVGLSQYIVGWSDAELMDETVAKTGNPVISLGTAKVNSLGEAEIPVYITNNTGFAGFNFKLEYDEEKVEILSITPNTELIQGNFITNIGSIDERGLLVTWYQNDNITADGLLFTVKAKLVDGVDVACVSIVPANNNMCDENKANVEAEYTEGYVLRDKYVRSEVITAEGKTFCNLYFDGSFEEQSATAIVAFYDGIKLSQTKIVPVTVKAGKVELPLENVTSNYTSYKVFVWKDAEKFIPLVEAK